MDNDSGLREDAIIGRVRVCESQQDRKSMLIVAV